MASTKGPFVMPGDAIDQANIPSHPKKALQLGPGLRHIPPTTILPTVAGQLTSDRKKNSIWVEYNGGHYVPSQGDLIIGQVHHGGADFYHVQISPHTAHALLPVLAFEMATKKTRPQLSPGQLVYARVAMANKHMDPELECVHPATGKADGLGPLTGGMLFSVSPGFARRLLMPRSTTEGGVVVLEELGGAGLGFETAVGRNGRVWVNSALASTVVLVGRALVQADEGRLDVEAQRDLVKRLVKGDK